jgi:hypothetical protein
MTGSQIADTRIVALKKSLDKRYYAYIIAAPALD